MSKFDPNRERNGQRPSYKFRPRFTIGILYLAAFFFLFAFLQILPDLIGLLELPPGPEQEAAAREVARKKSSPLLSILLSVIATGIGAYYEILPGLKEG